MSTSSVVAPLDLADRVVFAGVVRAYQSPLARYALRLTGSAALAADLVQDVFLTLWERRHEIEAGGAFRSLLFTMVRNRAFNHHRKTQFRATDGDPEAVEAATHGGPSAHAELEAADLQAHVRVWVGMLPPRRAEAFMLSRDQGLSYAEIADVMGCSRRTVETHVFQALRHLRERYDALQSDST